MHGLPREHSGPIESWSELLGYLGAIASSDMPVEVSVTAPGSRWRLFAARGKLSCIHRKEGGGVTLTLGDYPKRDTGADVWLEEKLFRGGRLTTFDGDDYFDLTIETPGGPLLIGDTNKI